MSTVEQLNTDRTSMKSAVDQYSTDVEVGDAQVIEQSKTTTQQSMDMFSKTMGLVKKNNPTTPELDLFDITGLTAGKIQDVKQILFPSIIMLPAFQLQDGQFLNFGDIDSPANGMVTFTTVIQVDALPGTRQTIFTDGGQTFGWSISIIEDGRFVLRVRIDGPERSVYSTTVAEAGKKYTITGRLDQAAGDMVLFINGVEEGRNEGTAFGNYDGSSGTYIGRSKVQDVYDGNVISGSKAQFFGSMAYFILWQTRLADGLLSALNEDIQSNDIHFNLNAADYDIASPNVVEVRTGSNGTVAGPYTPKELTVVDI